MGRGELREDEVMMTRRTFQNEFAPGSDPRWGQVRGRVEHLTWGDGTRFQSLDELLRFIGVTLRTLEGRAVWMSDGSTRSAAAVSAARARPA
jgi:hypothetical protein